MIIIFLRHWVLFHFNMFLGQNELALLNQSWCRRWARDKISGNSEDSASQPQPTTDLHTDNFFSSPEEKSKGPFEPSKPTSMQLNQWCSYYIQSRGIMNVWWSHSLSKRRGLLHEKLRWSRALAASAMRWVWIEWMSDLCECEDFLKPWR